MSQLRMGRGYWSGSTDSPRRSCSHSANLNFQATKHDDGAQPEDDQITKPRRTAT